MALTSEDSEWAQGPGQSQVTFSSLSLPFFIRLSEYLHESNQ